MGVWSLTRSSHPFANPARPQPTLSLSAAAVREVGFPSCAVSCSSPIPAVTHQGLPPAPGGMVLLFLLARCSRCSETSDSRRIPKASRLRVSRVGRTCRNGYFPPNERGAADYMGCLLQTPPVSKTPFFLLWLGWYFQKHLVLCLVLLIATWLLSEQNPKRSISSPVFYKYAVALSGLCFA